MSEETKTDERSWTKGPLGIRQWEQGGEVTAYEVIMEKHRDETSWSLCTVTDLWGDPCRHTARLFAAAPDLYETLETLVDAMERDCMDDPFKTEIAQARAALAKARVEGR